MRILRAAASVAAALLLLPVLLAGGAIVLAISAWVAMAEAIDRQLKGDHNEQQPD